MIKNEILITELNNQKMFFALIDNRLEYLEVFDEESLTGRLFVGRVENIVSNIDSAFVRFMDDLNGYLSLKDVCAECVLNRDFLQNPKLRNGDLVLVQVVNDALKTKLPKLTCKLSLGGKYCAITLGEKGVGCSRKLPEEKRRDLIYSVKDYLSGKLEYNAIFNCGIILRTDAGNPDVEISDIIGEIKDLSEAFKQMLDKAKCLSACQEVIFNEAASKFDDVIKRFVHVVNCFNKEQILIGTDDKKVYDRLLLNKDYSDSELYLLKYFDIETENARPLSVIYGLENKLEDCTKKKVWLKSGGYLVIEQTEALNVIDVNTGKSISGKKNIAMKLNQEAMEESMRQIRLRNLSGMILIDFINMKSKDENNHLIDNIKAMTKLDPVNINFVDITGLGIIELTRKKTGKSLIEVLTK